MNTAKGKTYKAKYEKGNLVEIISTKRKAYIGHRFRIQQVRWDGIKVRFEYLTDIEQPCDKEGKHKFRYVLEHQIKPVNPDGDELVKVSFKELMDGLTVDS